MTGFIYAVAAGDAVKIGWSSDPVKRAAKIKSDNPSAVLLGFMPGSVCDEADIHASLIGCRISGEWFARGGDVDHVVNRMSLPPQRPKRGANGRGAIGSYRAANNLTLEAFGALVDAHKSAVFKWEAGIGPSPQTAIRIEEVTGGEISRHTLRPDLWPAPATAPAREGEAA